MPVGCRLQDCAPGPGGRAAGNLDRGYVARHARQIREHFPGCPPGAEQLIAEHACLKYSNRVGRSAAAKRLDEDAVRAAVVAHIRHT